MSCSHYFSARSLIRQFTKTPDCQSNGEKMNVFRYIILTCCAALDIGLFIFGVVGFITFVGDPYPSVPIAMVMSWTLGALVLAGLTGWSFYRTAKGKRHLVLAGNTGSGLACAWDWRCIWCPDLFPAETLGQYAVPGPFTSSAAPGAGRGAPCFSRGQSGMGLGRCRS